MMKRRTLLKSATVGAAILGMPKFATAQAKSVLRIVPHTDLAVVDPIWTSALITLEHGYAVFDTLYGTDETFKPRPQMVSEHTVSADGLTWTLTLRDGLMFHDGNPVRARDAVASVKRWGKRDVLGRELMSVTKEITAPDDKTIVFTLTRPFPLLPAALGKPSANMPAIMPERLANIDDQTQIKEVVGSGPFKFVAKEWVAGSKVVYEKFDGYVPRKDAASFTAGAKAPKVDRVEWVVIPDVATAASALMAGEVDVWEKASPDFLPMIEAQANIRSETGTIPDFYVLRINHLHPPFNNPAIRRAVLPALDQSLFMTAIGGSDPRGWVTNPGFFNPASPMANDAGSKVLTSPRSMDAARKALKDAGYDGTPVVLLDPQDVSASHAGTLVAAELLRQIGFKVDQQATDWGTIVQRRTSKAAPAQGGWNMFITALSSTGAFDPSLNFALRGNGQNAWFGWPDMPKIEELRQKWLYAPDLQAQKDICREIQEQAFQDMPYIPLGGVLSFNAVNKRVSNLPREYIRFYNVEVK